MYLRIFIVIVANGFFLKMYFNPWTPVIVKEKHVYVKRSDKQLIENLISLFCHRKEEKQIVNQTKMNLLILILIVNQTVIDQSFVVFKSFNLKIQVLFIYIETWQVHKTPEKDDLNQCLNHTNVH